MSDVRVRFSVLLTAAFFLAAAAAGAQSLSVSYLDGSAQVRAGTAWAELAVGDPVPLDASVRLQGGGTLQLRGTGAEFFINRPGTYVVREILAAREKLSSKTSAAAILKGLRYLVAGKGVRPSSTGGARAGDQSDSEEDAWVESSSQVFLDAGKEYLRSGKLDESVRQLDLALQSAGPEDAAEIRYYKAFAVSLKGDTRGAWKLMESLQPGGSEAWAGDFVLLKAKMLQDSNAFSESVRWLGSNDLSRDALRGPMYFFLLGSGYRAAGDEQKAAQAFGDVQRMAPGSDLAQAAAEYTR